MDLASVAQLRTRLQRPELDEATAQQALAEAASLLSAVSGQDVDHVTGDEVILTGGRCELWLPQRPVTSVSLVAERGALGTEEYLATADRDYYLDGDRLVKPQAPRWQPYASAHAQPGWDRPRALGVWAPRVRVVYSHGYETAPAWLTAIALDAAAVIVSNPGALRSETVGSESWTYATESLRAPGALLEAIRQKFRQTGTVHGAFSIG